MVVANCGTDSASCLGGENCACYGNGTCDDGLDCRSKVCVNLNSTGVGGGSGGGGLDVQACLSCAETNCPSQAMDCKSATGCEDIIKCMVGCNKDATCLSKCNANASVDANTKSLAYQTCAFTSCVSDCVYSGGSTVAGGASGDNSTGSGSGGSGNGGSKTGSGGATGMAGGGGSGPVELVKGVNWLGLSSDAAPPTLGPNGKLGINGVFYAYGDGCSTAHFDMPTRCVSGDLCVASAANWGVSIGFDLNNSGDVKHPWSATAVGVTGIAWETHGVLPTQPQVWILNMDPKFSGMCTAAECGINGPPDGTPAASAKGQLLFSAMMKDNWGGTGTVYTFNPANISAIQFKIPAAVSSSDTTYELCIDRLGVIR
jgi:hypothetical protein